MKSDMDLQKDVAAELKWEPRLKEDEIGVTVQNGVDSAGEVAAVAGEARTLGGTTYIATALEAQETAAQALQISAHSPARCAW